MFNLFWVPNLRKIRYIAFLRPNLPKHNFGSRSVISNIIFMINELDLLSVTNFIALGYIWFLGPTFYGMRGLILVLMSNVCYLAVILIFLVVSWWLPLVTWWLLLVTAHYLVVTAHYWSLLLVPTFSMNAVKLLKTTVTNVHYLNPFSNNFEEIRYKGAFSEYLAFHIWIFISKVYLFLSKYVFISTMCAGLFAIKALIIHMFT